MWRHRSGRRRRRKFDVGGRRRRLVRRAWIAGGLAMLVAVLGAFALSEAVRARTRMNTARTSLQAAVDDPSVLATPEGRTAALGQVDSAIGSIRDARSHVAGSPVLALAAAIPGLRGQRSGLIRLIDDSAAAAGAGR